MNFVYYSNLSSVWELWWAYSLLHCLSWVEFRIILFMFVHTHVLYMHTHWFQSAFKLQWHGFFSSLFSCVYIGIIVIDIFIWYFDLSTFITVCFLVHVSNLMYFSVFICDHFCCIWLSTGKIICLRGFLLKHDGNLCFRASSPVS